MELDQDEFIILDAAHLQRNFDARIAVHDFSLQLRKGEVVGLLGPNGAGKTTTLQMISGNLAPTSGSVKVCGIDLLDDPRKAKTSLGYLPELPPLYIDMTVDEYLSFVACLHRIDKQNITFAQDNCKRQCGLNDYGGHLIGTLSKGLQQRVGIAQAIIHQPDLIILDEPTVGLDPNQVREMRELIRGLGKARGVILSTHVLSEVDSICDRILIMCEGRLVLNETIAALKQKHVDLETLFTQLTLVVHETH